MCRCMGLFILFGYIFRIKKLNDRLARGRSFFQEGYNICNLIVITHIE